MSQYHYKTREVRDLAWACFSPPLFHTVALHGDDKAVSNCALVLSEQRRRWLHDLDTKPEALHNHLRKLRSTRLGLYFESLWHFFLASDPQIDLIAHNLPVRAAGKTVGEFDCLYYCQKRRAYFHLELAVKYYLSHRRTTTNNTASQWREWLGPTNTDHLDRKIEHLFGHQIMLGEHPAGQSALQQLGINSFNREVEIKGYLFQSRADPLQPPQGYNDENILSAWLNVAELPNFLAAASSAQYCQLDKPQWLAPAQAGVHANQLMGSMKLVEKLNRHFNNQGRPVLLAAFDDAGEEQRRFFVTGADWPTNSGKPGISPSPL